MKTKLFVFLISTFCFVQLAFAQSVVSEFPEMQFDERSWKIGYLGTEKSRAVIEYVLNDQTIYNWTELVTIEGSFDTTDFKGILENKKVSLAKVGGDGFTWTVLEDSPTEMLVLWQFKDVSNQDNQTELIRAFAGTKGVYILHYVQKHEPLSDEKRTQWVKLLKNSNINPDSKIFNWDIISEMETNPALLGYKATALLNQGQIEKGLNLLDKTILLDPQNYTWHLIYARLLYPSARQSFVDGKALLKIVEDELQKTIALLSDQDYDRKQKVECYLTLGDIHKFAYGDLTKSDEFYQKALALDPSAQINPPQPPPEEK